MEKNSYTDTDRTDGTIRRAIGARPWDEENLLKSLYSLQLPPDENGPMKPIGMGCAVEVFCGDDKEYYILTSDLIIPSETYPKLKCCRYRSGQFKCGQFKFKKDHHEIELTDPQQCQKQNLKQFNGCCFLQLSKAPKWHLTCDLQSCWYEKENKPVLTCHTFCKNESVELKFQFVDGQYKMHGTLKEAGASGKTDLVGAPLFIKEKCNGVVGVVGQSDNEDELCPILFCAPPRGEEDIASAVEEQQTEERELPNESQKCRCELPEEPKNIHGHDNEVKLVVEELGCNNTPVVIVYGGAGDGKTTVATQASYQMCRSGNTVLFRNLRRSPDEKETICQKLLRICDPGKSRSDSTKGELENWCRMLNHEIILVLDNAEDELEEHNKNSFIELLEEMRKCSKKKIKFLITSRRADVFNSNLSIKRIEVKVLEPEESLEILKCYSNLQASAKTTKLKTVAEKCGHIPLALRLAGGLLSHESQYKVKDLIRDLERSPTTTLRVEEIIKTTFEKLDKKRKDALVKLSVFVGSFSEDTASRGELLGEDCSALLNDLAGRSLIQCESEYREESESHSRYSLHLLIRDYACKMGNQAEFSNVINVAKNAFYEYFYSTVLRQTEHFFSKDCCKASIDAFNKERLNLECCLKFEPEDVRNCKALDEVLRKCRTIALYIEYCIPFSRYFDFLKRLLAVSQKKEEQKVHEIEILCLLAYESRKHGDEPQLHDYMQLAIKNHEEHKESFQRNTDFEVFYSYHYGRYLHQNCGDKKNASTVLSKAVSICKENNRDSHPDLPRILSQQGHSLKLQKFEEEAHKKYSEGLKLRQRFHGQYHIFTAFAYKDFADSYFFFDNYVYAEGYYAEAIHILKSIEMFEQKEAVPILKNVAICSEKQEKFEKARRLYEQGKRIAENTIEGNHKWKIWINTLLAVLIFEQYADDVQVAIKIAAEVFRMSKDLKMEKTGWRKKQQLRKLYDKHKKWEVKGPEC